MKTISDSYYLIMGSASRTGNALAQYMSKHHLRHSLSDNKAQSFIDYSQKTSSATPPIHIFQNSEQTVEQLDSVDRIVVSPGIPMCHPLLQEARNRSIRVDSEIAFCYEVLKEEKRLPFFIGITGSLGKSTTATLTHKLLSKGLVGKNVYLLGNIGTPLSSHLDILTSEDIVVLELSSYQLEDAQKYHLDVATLLNITPNHLDRYDSMKEYQLAKEKIFASQTSEDFAVFNKSHTELSEVLPRISAQKIFVSSYYDPNCMYSFDFQGDIYMYDKIFLQNSSLALKSPHILEDMCSALALSSVFDIPSSVKKSVLSTFTGLEHRSEWVAECNSIQFINDSKSTTPFSVLPNLLDSSYGGMILILGGKNKDLDFSILSSHLQNVLGIVYYGQDGEKIRDALPFSASEYIYNFSDAVMCAYELAKKHKAQTVLLSPGCTSFDQFESYEQRGTCFKQIVRSLSCST